MATPSQSSRTALRSISILVTPPPVTFAERRSVLQVLERQGRVQFFKMAPGYQSSFFCITYDETTAKALVNTSPLTYAVSLPRPKAAELYATGLPRPDWWLNDKKPNKGKKPTDGDHDKQAKAADDNTGSSDVEQRSFKLEIFPAPDFSHEYAMTGSPLHHAWPRVYAEQKTRTASILSRVLPQTVASQGLQHWFFEKGLAPRPDPKMQRLLLKSWLPSKMAAQARDERCYEPGAVY